MIGRKVEKYCCEDISLIENYEEAVKSPEFYDCHHRLEIQGDKVLTREELKAAGLYYDRPASELIFLQRCEHLRIHRLTGDHNGEKCNFYGLTGEKHPRSKIVLCVETGVEYGSTLEASRQTRIAQSSISKCARGMYKTAGGLHWKRV